VSASFQQAGSLRDLMRAVDAAVTRSTRFRASWISWFDPDEPSIARVLAGLGGLEADHWENLPIIPRADAMLDEIARGAAPVIVEDARTDPRTNKEQVAKFDNRTIVHVPVVLGGSVRGTVSAGTFGAEGVRVPTGAELEALTLIATLLAPAFDRVTAVAAKEKAEKERLALERHLESLQRVELMGVLSAGVAHDLNNLLGIGLISLSTLERDRLGPDVVAVDDAIRALERMRDISKQLLELGRSRAAHLEDIDLAAKVESTIQLVRPSIPRSVEVKVDHVGAPRVEGDPVQLEQAVANLVINARDAVGLKGRIELLVDEQRFDEARAKQLPGARPGAFAHVRVKDTGPGIPPELRQRVFDPLFTTKPTGTGLGLAVVSRIVAHHHGFVAVDSPPGQGAAFDVYLPVR
jgi:signal transduction histidine kinase